MNKLRKSCWFLGWGLFLVIVTLSTISFHINIHSILPGESFHFRSSLGKGESTCSAEATGSGKGQRVISYSLFAANQSDIPAYLFEGLKLNLDEIQEFYPGWVTRVYTNLPKSKFRELISKYAVLYWCDIQNIPGFGNLSLIDGRSWRFLPLGDPLVDIFLSRDLDSRIYPRERAAVEEWENSNYTIHSMRDHPFHGVPLLGGMWGAKNTLLGPERSKRLQLHIIEKAAEKSEKNWDQILLNKVIYSELNNETMAHDSYLCGRFPDQITLPFPTRRENGRFVGSIMDDPISASYATCPEKCRRHKNWTHC